MQSSYFSEMLDAAWPSVPALGINEKVLANSLVTPIKENEADSYYPTRTSDDKAEADQLMIEMLRVDVPQSIIRSIVQSDSYDIIPPKDATTAPFLVITYANKTDEDIRIANNNWQPRQDTSFLQVPKPGMPANVRAESEDLEIDEDTWAGFEWNFDVDMEHCGYSSEDMFSALALDSTPFGIPVDSTSGWPSDPNTRYFVGYTRRRGVESTAGWLDMRASAMEFTRPWKTVKFGFVPTFTPNVVQVQSTIKAKAEVEDWSDDFDMGEEGLLEVDGNDGGEMDNSYDEDATMHEETESDLNEPTDSECEGEPRVTADC